MITGNSVVNIIYEGSKNFMLVISIILVTIVLQRIVAQFISNSFKKSSKFIKVDETQYRFFKHFISALILIVGLGISIYTVPSLRTLSISLFAGAGILTVIIGFAAQNAFANIVSGIFIVIFKPFRVGDRITIGDRIRGVVEDINLRHSVIKTFENKRIIVPNSIISNEYVENASISDERICRFIDFGISYESNIDKAMKIMTEEALKHKLHIDGRNKQEKKNNEPIANVKVLGFSDSSVNLRLWVWAKDFSDAFNLACDLNKSIKERFDKEGIEIPYPHRTIIYKNSTKKKSVKSKIVKNKKNR